MKEKILDIKKINSDSLEIKITYCLSRGSGGVEHIITFNSGKDILGNSTIHVSYDESRNFDEKKYLEAEKARAVQELFELGYKSENNEKDAYLIKAIKII